ncbi:anti-sigma factor family protein [Mycolicibacterium confluentis]|uniref:Anti-sigma-L factor RslA n=1 Tax=Mycolicibacterium confluentis TaxID=28047 RepID=A0A7I7Y294_9MYCO|nr:zf-HC2 domain-containing protein [Mycolicibacterium confluentis]MCV7320128.1 zf-HC2 domain-containing protein [Mycolicibacterium confluentis]ORV34660.1 hypothetical protein AWB99_03440 [Mycolicibacterium confluentis]BBZ35162.1 anti-sigma-L factor RslA [Mycolicibacterium confluentis]
MTADVGAQGTGADPYELWDAAYVLGSLSTAQRHEYERHLAGCAGCREAVSAISGMPALLALLDRDAVAAAGDCGTVMAAPPLPERLLDNLLARVQARRHRIRLATAAVATVAAVALLLAVFVTLRSGVFGAGDSGAGNIVQAMPMTPVVASEYEATVALSSRDWGTHIQLECTYHSWAADSNGHSDDDGDTGDTLAMVAVGRDGSQTRLATWRALPAATALPSASTSMPMEQIASVQIVSADTGDVLLQRTL